MVLADMPATAAASIAYVRTERIRLADLSTAEDSGWRAVNNRRVSEIVEVLKAGDFGKTTLAKPSVVCNQSDEVPPEPSQVDRHVSATVGQVIRLSRL